MKHYYLVWLHLQIDDKEKYTARVVQAMSAIDAGIAALRKECHNKPDFSEFSEHGYIKDGNYMYTVWSVQEMGTDEYNTFMKFSF